MGGEWRLDVWDATTLAGPDGDVRLRPRERSVLAALAVDPGASTTFDRIIDLIWGATPPATARKAVQNHVARLRHEVGEDVVLTTSDGYAIGRGVVVVEPDRIDGRSPFADLADGAATDDARQTALEARRRRAVAMLSARIEAADPDALIDAQTLVNANPLDEAAWELLILAFARHGRRREALQTLAAARSQLKNAGLPLGLALRDLDRRLNDDDPSLLSSAAGQVSAVDPSRLVGLDELADQFEEGRAAGSQVHTTVITGDAGIGKTTLAEHLRERAARSGITTFTASCTPEPSVPLEPFTDLVQQIAERFPDQIAAAADIGILRSLAPELSVTVAPPKIGADRSALFGEIRTALHCAGRPILVLIEDLHWATPLTLQLLAACVADAASSTSPVTIIATSRVASDSLTSLAETHIELQAWPVSRVAEYVAQFGRAADWTAGAAAWIHRQSNGNALHVRELTLAALDTDGVDDFVEPGAAPASLQAAYDQRLRALSIDVRQHLEAAAVLGRRFRLDEAAQMVGSHDVELLAARDASIIRTVADGTAEFRHDLLHAAVLASIAAGRRVELHDQAATVIEQVSDSSARLDELSHHAVAAAALDPARALRWSMDAAGASTQRFAYEDAIARYESIIPLLDSRSPEWCRVMIRLGQMLLRVGDERALDHLLGAARAAIETGDQMLAAQALRETCRLGPTSVVGTVHDDTRQLLADAEELITEPEADAIIATAGVMLYAISGEYERCRSYFDRAVAFDEPGTTRTDALSLAVLALHDVDDFDRRAMIERELRELSVELSSPDAAWGAAHLAMTNQMQLGDPAMGDTLVELGELTDSLRQRTRLWEFTNWTAAYTLISGDPDAAEVHATEALGCIDAVAESLVMSAYGAQLLAIRLLQGRAAELKDTVAAIVSEGDAIGAWHAVLALAAAEDGDDALAREQLDIVLADDLAVLDRDYTYNGALALAGETAVLLGDDVAGAVIESHLAAWSGLWTFVGTCTNGPIDVTLARLARLDGRVDDADRLARSALDQAERVGAPLYAEIARSLLG